MKSVYPAVFRPEETGYNVSFPDLPGCFSEGGSLAEAIDMAAEALGGYLAARLDLDLPIAAPSRIEDIKEENGFIIQQNIISQHYRLLDADGNRVSSSFNLEDLVQA